LTPVGRELEKLLKIPINNFNDIMTVLRLSHFAPLLQLFDFDGRKSLAVFIAENVLENETQIPNSEQVDTILGLLAPLIADQVKEHFFIKWVLLNGITDNVISQLM
jgi:vacuolar protein sorting-associated protein 35